MDPQEKYIEDFGIFFEQLGVQRMAGRILAWLLICDPPEQTMGEITQALQASKSSISTTLRQLVQFRMVERVSIPGIRADYYRVSRNFWREAMEDSLRKFRTFQQLADEGLALLDGEAPQRRARLEEMRDLYSFLLREFPALAEQWYTERKAVE